MIDEYLVGELPEAEREAFELHYFGCDAYFQELKQREQLIDFIRRIGGSLFSERLENGGIENDRFQTSGKILSMKNVLHYPINYLVLEYKSYLFQEMSLFVII